MNSKTEFEIATPSRKRLHQLRYLGDLAGKLVSIDGVQLQDLDYVDIGSLLDPPGVVPVVIKSLLFP